MSSNKKKVIKCIGLIFAALGLIFIGLKVVAGRKKGDFVYKNEPEQRNPMAGKKVVFIADENDKENADGVKGHLESVGVSDYHPGIYDRYIKRFRRSNGLTTVTADGFFVRIFSRICLLWLQLQRLRC